MRVDVHRITVERTARVLVQGDLRTAPTLWILLHGYAQRAEEMLASCAALQGLSSALVAPEALSRFYRRGPSGPVGASWMTREERAVEIADYVAYLERVAAWIDRQRSSAPSRRVVLGFSQGAATAWRWLEQGASTHDVVVGWGGGFPPDFRAEDARARSPRAAWWSVRGRGDTYHTSEWLERDRAASRAAGRMLHALEFDGGHEMTEQALRELARSIDAPART
jgi:dienelactone hydrolase